MKSKDVDFEKVIDDIVEKSLNDKLGEIYFNKVRKRSFIVLTFVYAAIALLFYFLKLRGADFIMQLFIGFATGCLVVAGQEIAKEEEYKKEKKRGNE